jgi:hypothetical protein
MIGLSRMTISAQRHVHVRAPDHAMAVFARSSERERSVVLAQLANGAQLSYFLAQGNQLGDVWPWATQKGPLKC